MLSLEKLISNQLNLIDVSITFDKEKFISNVYINFQRQFGRIWLKNVKMNFCVDLSCLPNSGKTVFTVCYHWL